MRLFRPGTVVWINGEPVICERVGSALGLRHLDGEWLAGGPGLAGRSLRALWHIAAKLTGEEEFRSEARCVSCGGSASVQMLEGYEDDEREVYESRCPACRHEETWEHDGRDTYAPLTEALLEAEEADEPLEAIEAALDDYAILMQEADIDPERDPRRDPEYRARMLGPFADPESEEL